LIPNRQEPHNLTNSRYNPLRFKNYLATSCLPRRNAAIDSGTANTSNAPNLIYTKQAHHPHPLSQPSIDQNFHLFVEAVMTTTRTNTESNSGVESSGVGRRERATTLQVGRPRSGLSVGRVAFLPGPGRFLSRGVEQRVEAAMFVLYKWNHVKSEQSLDI
jgi:hypothetical protein